MPSPETIKAFARAILEFPEPLRQKAQDLMQGAYRAGAADYERARLDVETANLSIGNALKGGKGKHGSH